MTTMIELLRATTVDALRERAPCPMFCDRYRKVDAILFVLFVRCADELRQRTTVAEARAALAGGLDELARLGLVVAREGLGYRWHGSYFEDLVSEAFGQPDPGALVAPPVVASPSFEPDGDGRAPRPDPSRGEGRDGGAPLALVELAEEARRRG